MTTFNGTVTAGVGGGGAGGVMSSTPDTMQRPRVKRASLTTNDAIDNLNVTAYDSCNFLDGCKVREQRKILQSIFFVFFYRLLQTDCEFCLLHQQRNVGVCTSIWFVLCAGVSQWLYGTTNGKVAQNNQHWWCIEVRACDVRFALSF